MITRLVLLALAASAFFAPSVCAQNQNSMVDTQGLQHTTFYKDRLRLQRVNTAPIFTDCVRPDQPPMNIRVITRSRVPGQPAGTVNAGEIQIIGGPPVSTSNPMVPGLRDLPASQFDSKIPQAINAPNRMLPDATTTNRLRGKMVTPAQASPQTVLIKNAAPNTVAPGVHTATPPAAATYEQIPAVSSNAGNRTKTEVRGIIKHKALLDRIRD